MIRELYPLSYEYAQLVDAYRECESDEDLARLEDLLVSIDERFEQTVLDACAAIKNFEGEAKMLKSEKLELENRQRVAELRMERLKERVKHALETSGRMKMDLGLFQPRVQRNSRPSFACAEPQTLPEEYQRIKYTIDDERAMRAWKAGETLPEGLSGFLGTHLRM